MLRPLLYRKAWVKGNGSATTRLARIRIGSKSSLPQPDDEVSPVKADARLMEEMEYQLQKHEGSTRVYGREYDE